MVEVLSILAATAIRKCTGVHRGVTSFLIWKMRLGRVAAEPLKVTHRVNAKELEDEDGVTV